MCMHKSTGNRPRKLQRYYYKVMNLVNEQLCAWANSSEKYEQRKWYKASSQRLGFRCMLYYDPCFHVYSKLKDARLHGKHSGQVIVRVRCKHFVAQGISYVYCMHHGQIKAKTLGFKYQYIVGVVD